MALEMHTREAPAKESFAALLDESLGVVNSLEGTVVKGRVIAVENDAVLIDVGLKSEGRVPLKEFAVGGGALELQVGDTVEVYLERMEDKNGEAQLSREKAKREEAWTLLERVKTNTSSAEDRERLAHLIQVTTAVTDQLRAAPDVQTPPVSQRLSPQRKTKRKAWSHLLRLRPTKQPRDWRMRLPHQLRLPD